MCPCVPPGAPSSHFSWRCRGRAAAVPEPRRLCPGLGWARAAASASGLCSASGRSPTCSLARTERRSTASMRCTGKASSSRRDWISCWKRRVRAAGCCPSWRGTPGPGQSCGVPCQYWGDALPRFLCGNKKTPSSTCCPLPSPPVFVPCQKLQT